MSTSPTRAFRLTLQIGADTREALSNALFNLATRVDRDELSNGISGGPDSGYTYELLHDPAQTHKRYFEELNEYLESLKAARTPATK